MNFDPQKFFIGLMDFFSILLPGALLTYLLMGEVGPVVLGDRYALLAGAQAWAAFLIVSYLIGYLVFLCAHRVRRSIAVAACCIGVRLGVPTYELRRYDVWVQLAGRA